MGGTAVFPAIERADAAGSAGSWTRAQQSRWEPRAQPMTDGQASHLPVPEAKMGPDTCSSPPAGDLDPASR